MAIVPRVTDKDRWQAPIIQTSIDVAFHAVIGFTTVDCPLYENLQSTLRAHDYEHLVGALLTLVVPSVELWHIASNIDLHCVTSDTPPHTIFLIQNLSDLHPKLIERITRLFSLMLLSKFL